MTTVNFYSKHKQFRLMVRLKWCGPFANGLKLVNIENEDKSNEI